MKLAAPAIHSFLRRAAAQVRVGSDPTAARDGGARLLLRHAQRPFDYASPPHEAHVSSNRLVTRVESRVHRAAREGRKPKHKKAGEVCESPPLYHIPWTATRGCALRECASIPASVQICYMRMATAHCGPVQHALRAAQQLTRHTLGALATVSQSSCECHASLDRHRLLLHDLARRFCRDHPFQ